MKAVILAAGAGTRFGSLTEQVPKCLLPLGDRALLDHQLDALAQAGISDVTVVAGFQSRRIVEHLGGRCRVVLNDQYASTNSIVSLHRASAAVRGEAFLFQNADVLYTPELIGRFVAAPPANGCLVDAQRAFVEGEYHVELDQGRIVRYSREVPPERSVGESGQLVKIGAADSMAFLDRLGQVIASGGHGGFPNQAYDALIGGEGFWPVYTAGLSWWEIDTPEDYARCQGALVPPVSLPPSSATLADSVVSLLREPRIPWRLRWTPDLLRLATQRPLRGVRHVLSFLKGDLSRDGLDLMVSGPTLLGLTLAECRRAGLHPFLLWGTLLGCMREGGFIRNDHDIDLGILEAESSRLPTLRAAMLRHGFRVRIENAYKLSFVHARYPHLYIDLDVVRGHRDGWAITNADADPSRLFHYRFAHGVFAGSRTRRFAGAGEVLVPADPEEFLDAVYGDWSRPQPKTHYIYGPLNLEVEILPPSGAHP